MVKHDCYKILCVAVQVFEPGPCFIKVTILQMTENCLSGLHTDNFVFHKTLQNCHDSFVDLYDNLIIFHS